MKDNVKYYLKCLGNLLMHILLLLSCLTPRNRRKWLVGNARGFNNNTKYFFIHCKEVLHMRQCYFICKNRKYREEIGRLGYQAYHPWSLKGLYHLLTAGVYVYDSHISALNYWTSGRALKVNLWHGVGIKNIEFKRHLYAKSRRSDWQERLRRPVNYVRPDLFLSTSPLMTTHFAQCFRIPESRCVESEYPRCAIFKKSREELLAFIDRYEPEETRRLARQLTAAKRTYIYMPTFRDSKKDLLEAAGFNLDMLEQALAERDALFLFKLHPFTRVTFDDTRYPHIRLLDNRMDIYPLLPLTDVLVTDYSSIYYDYLLLPDKETVLFPFDYEEYIAGERDLAFDFDTYTPGPRVHTFGQLVEAIREERHFTNEKKAWITGQFWQSDRPEDLYRAIASRLSPRQSARKPMH